jgi:hypothetical protein
MLTKTATFPEADPEAAHVAIMTAQNPMSCIPAFVIFYILQAVIQSFDGQCLREILRNSATHRRQKNELRNDYQYMQICCIELDLSIQL